MNSALILVWDHGVDAVTGPGYSIAQGLSALGVRTTCLSVIDSSGNLNHDSITQVMHDESIVNSDIVICMAALPLSITWNGRPLYEVLGKRFYLYSLDALFYDLTRVPGVVGFVDEAKRSSRLGIMSPDLDNSQLTNELLGRQGCTYVPFAGSLQPLTDEPRNGRIAVIGTMGQELVAVPDDSTFEDLVLTAPSELGDHERLRNLAELIEQPGANLNVAATVKNLLGIDAEALYSREVSGYLCSLDAFQKRRRRKLAIEQLRDAPVDFYGQGWEPFVDGFANVRLMGSVSHLKIGLICQRYSALLNFDPNWDHGLHDRVYTGLASGTRILTNRSKAISQLAQPDEHAIQVYDANAPAELSELAARALSLPAPDSDSLLRFRHENSGLARMDRFLSEVGAI